MMPLVGIFIVWDVHDAKVFVIPASGIGQLVGEVGAKTSAHPRPNTVKSANKKYPLFMLSI